MGPEGEHADIETASEDYARRFAGGVGAYFLETQAQATLALLSAFRGGSVLDVGGGHGQLAGPLADAGYAATLFGSHGSCVARVRGLVDAGRVRFQSGNLLDLPYPPESFDWVLAFRLLPHVARWRALVAELCRVARRGIVVDYPTSRSVNAAAGALFGLKKRVEGNTRPFLVFHDAEIAAAFAENGFAVTGRRPQFFFPMAFHRALRVAALSRSLEGLALALGLTSRYGSPVILRAESAKDARG